MLVIDLTSLVKHKVHIGHKLNTWDPRFLKYIYKFYKNYCLINLIETKLALIKAYNFLYILSKKGKEIIFIGSKPTGKLLIKEAALLSTNFYINTRWVPGTFTNDNLIKNRICLMIWFEKIFFELKKKNKFSKKLTAQLNFIYKKTKKNFKGLKGLMTLPKTIFVLDAKYETLAFHESMLLKRNIISLVDSNMNPTHITLPIPGNDDNLSSITLILQILTTSLIQGALTRTSFNET